MADATSQTQQIQGCIDRLKQGDEAARKELLNCACTRLTQLTRKMLNDYSRLRRWEQTDDVFQSAAMRLYRTLGDIQPATPADFYRLAALNIRRELLDLARHYYGPQGLGAKHASQGGDAGPDQSSAPVLEPAATSGSAASLAAWSDFHRLASELPAEEREVFDLLWYQGLPQAEAAALLDVSERTIKRRWQSARLKLYEALGGQLPGE